MGGRFALLLGALGISACTVPGVNPGFVSTVPRQAGAVDVGMQNGVGRTCVEGCSDAQAWGSLHVDPYVTPALSVPLEGAVMDVGAKEPAESTRAGLRYRLSRNAAVGLGAGPTFSFGGDEAWMGGAFDVEAAVGVEGSVGALSVATRPTVAVGREDIDRALILPLEFAALLDLGRGVGLTAHVGGGVAVVSDYVHHETLGSTGAGLGAGVGFVWRVESIAPAPAEGRFSAAR